eukprot:9299971-Alexandrium_andersonii.AAC.1
MLLGEAVLPPFPRCMRCARPLRLPCPLSSLLPTRAKAMCGEGQGQPRRRQGCGAPDRGQRPGLCDD